MRSVTEEHTVPPTFPVVQLSVSDAFASLTDKEKLYAHWMSIACWSGAKIVFSQVSPESLPFYNILRILFSNFTPETLRSTLTSSNTVSEEEITHFLSYVAYFLGNEGNYLSFGDAKFVPRISKSALSAVFAQCAAENPNCAQLPTLWNLIRDAIYALEPSDLMLNFPPIGTSAYYTKDVTKEEIDKVSRFMVEKQIGAYNTRLLKIDGVLTLKIAAGDSKKGDTCEWEGLQIAIEYGDYDGELNKVAAALEKAVEYCANEHQREMLTHYIAHFKGGDLEDHRNAQRSWIRDIQPVVENNIGFIENYRDPAGMRGEFEGFVAVVNKDRSRKFGELVEKAPGFLAKLPWGPDFEKDKFQKPDFTSLEVITFCGSGIPAGINIPNYDDIRQSEGFKNVSLGNVLNAATVESEYSFLNSSDFEKYGTLQPHAFEVQVGGHELLGHGSGKLLMEGPGGELNFSGVVDPLTGSSVASWYRKGETYDSVFGPLGSSFEECRAECVGTLLSADSEFLEVFGYSGAEAEDITYINWLHMARAGVLGLEFYSPEKKRWRQAHMHARFAIFQVMLEAGNGFIEFDPVAKDPVITLDRTKIRSVGIPAVEAFLKKIPTANISAATELYEKYTSVTDAFLTLRETVLAKKKPRRVFVQANTKLVDGKVSLEEYPSTCEGMVQSWIPRF